MLCQAERLEGRDTALTSSFVEAMWDEEPIHMEYCKLLYCTFRQDLSVNCAQISDTNLPSKVSYLSIGDQLE
jgi:hypothetical protein